MAAGAERPRHFYDFIPQRARPFVLASVGLGSLGLGIGGTVAVGGLEKGGSGGSNDGRSAVTRQLETPTFTPTLTVAPTATETPTPIPPSPTPTEEPTAVPTVTRIPVTPRPPTAVPRIEPTKVPEISGVLSPDYERSLGNLINQARVQNGVKPLNTDPRLQRAAEQYIMTIYNYHWIADKRVEDVHSLQGSSAQGRIASAGYNAVSYGEVFGWAVKVDQTPLDAVILNGEYGWMNTGHRANILRSTFEDMGIGCASVVDFYKPFYPNPVPMLLCVVDFGRQSR